MTWSLQLSLPCAGLRRLATPQGRGSRTAPTEADVRQAEPRRCEVRLAGLGAATSLPSNHPGVQPRFFAARRLS